MTEDEFAFALRAAAKQHGIKLGVLEADGTRTKQAVAAAEAGCTHKGAMPGDCYADEKSGNFYTLDVTGSWIFGFNANDLRRKMRTSAFAKIADMFPAGWGPGEMT